MRRPLSRVLFPALLATGLLAAVTGPATAITGGELDEDHPYVGVMVAQDENGNPMWDCSGTLVSPTLFVTAGHCVEAPADQVELWFGQGPFTDAAEFPALENAPRYCDGVDGFPCSGDAGGTPETHPDFDPDSPTVHDLGVVVLDQPVTMPEYGQLPEEDELDRLKPGPRTTFTSVGYGLERSFGSGASWKDQGDRQRRVAHPKLVQINTGPFGDYAMVLSANGGTGGTCYGDSGGPNFLGDSTVIAGVTSFNTNDTCKGQAGVYRIDGGDDLDWLRSRL